MTHNTMFASSIDQSKQTNQPIHVLYITSQVSFQSGATHAMIHLAEYVQKVGVRSIIVAPFTPELECHLKNLGIEFERLGLLSLRASRAWRENLLFILRFLPHLFCLLRIISERKIDIVHINEVMDVVGMFAAKLSRRVCVIHIRAHFDDPLLSKALLSWANLFANQVIVPSNSVRRWIQVYCPALVPRVSVINDVAFDHNAFHPDVEGSGIRQEFDIAPQTPLIVLVSKLDRYKGHLVLLEAAPKVTEQFPDATFLFVGGVVTDNYTDAEYIKTYAQQLPSHCNIIFTGFRRDIPQFTAAADIFVHCPIYDDPFPTVVSQALFMGKTVIGSEIGGIAEQIVNGETGLLIPPNNATALATAIVDLIHNPHLRQKLAQGARREAEKRYIPSVQAENQVHEYQRLLGINIAS